MIAKVLFVALYLRQSRFAWHVGFIVTAAIIPISLLFIYFGSEAEKHQHSHPVIEIAIVFIVLVYFWKVRERYFEYVGRGI